VRDRNHQRDRRDNQNEQRNDEAGDPDEDENALALIRHQVDVAQGLRDPHERGNAGANQQERTERGAENIPADGPHAICASPLATTPRCPAPPMPATAHRCYSKAFFSLYLIGQQSGLAKAKPLTMHNKTLNRTLCPGRHRRAARAGLFERPRAASGTSLPLAGCSCFGLWLRPARPKSARRTIDKGPVLPNPPANREKTRPFPSLPAFRPDSRLSACA